MRKFRAVLTVSALLACAWMAGAAYPMFSTGRTGQAVTSTSATVTFVWSTAYGGASEAFNARWVTIRNRAASANDAFYCVGTAPATSACTRLPPGEGHTVYYTADGTSGWVNLGVICHTAETATVDVEAGR